MTEIILSNKKHGMLVLLLTIVLYILAVLGTIFFADEAQIAPLVLCILYLSLGWLPLLGLKVLGPQEALVLTLFGNYIGTLKGEGFYFVNPFCTAVNPAAKTTTHRPFSHGVYPCFPTPFPATQGPTPAVHQARRRHTCRFSSAGGRIL